MSDDFELHPRLEADTHLIGDTDLCRVLLAKDARFPWVILVPRQPEMREVFDLPPTDQILLMAEISHIAAEMKAIFGADKTNIASLGNMVPQLHIHVVMRFEDDAAWPGPIWGVGTPESYDEAGLAEIMDMVRACLP